jgi:hypothetical protein
VETSSDPLLRFTSPGVFVRHELFQSQTVRRPRRSHSTLRAAARVSAWRFQRRPLLTFFLQQRVYGLQQLPMVLIYQIARASLGTKCDFPPLVGPFVQILYGVSQGLRFSAFIEPLCLVKT